MRTQKINKIVIACFLIFTSFFNIQVDPYEALDYDFFNFFNLLNFETPYTYLLSNCPRVCNNDTLLPANVAVNPVISIFIRIQLQSNSSLYLRFLRFLVE